MSVKFRKNVTIFGITNNENFNFNLEFVPDEVTLKNFVYTNTGPNHVILNLVSNLVNDRIMFSFYGTSSLTKLNNKFNLQNFPRNSSFNFQICDARTGELYVFDDDSEYSCLLEFVKY